jgi:hypothetical protein
MIPDNFDNVGTEEFLSMDKEVFIEAHEELIEEYLEAHPEASYDLAYEITAHRANDRYMDKWAAQIDYARMIAKESH